MQGRILQAWEEGRRGGSPVRTSCAISLSFRNGTGGWELVLASVAIALLLTLCFYPGRWVGGGYVKEIWEYDLEG